jgi:uncharacterized oligopeptide transporter (OPT) family protein
MGIVGLILWCTLLFGLIVSIARLGRRVPSGWRRGSSDVRVLYHAVRYIPAAVIAFSTAGFFVSFAYLDPIYLLAAMAVGILALTGASRWAVTGSSPARARQRRAIRGQLPASLPSRSHSAW